MKLLFALLFVVIPSAFVFNAFEKVSEWLEKQYDTGILIGGYSAFIFTFIGYFTLEVYIIHNVIFS